MARFERSRERKGGFRGRGPKRDSEGRGGFKEHRESRRGPGRRPGHDRREKRDVERTEVTCDSCGVKCEVPFKPTSNKPVYCDDCFGKKGKNSSGPSERDIDIINEKLNKIMKALKIDD